MAVTHKLYGQAIFNALKADITDISSGGTSIKVCLLEDTYTFNQDTHTNYTDISPYEISHDSPNIGYTEGGKALSNKTLSYASKTTTFDADDVSWTTATFSAHYAVLYDDTPAAAADKKLISIIDFGEEKSATAATFQVVWAIGGIFSVVVS